MNLFQKIVEIRKVASGFSKDKKSYGYEYVSGNQILSKIKDKMNELNLLLIPSTKAGEHHTHEYKTSKGKDALDFVVCGEMSYTWINGDEPSETYTVDWAYYGQQDDISKAYGSALTYSERYFLLKCLGLPTDEDDPDSKDTRGKQGSGNKGSGKLSEAQVGRLFAIAKKNGHTNEDVKKGLMYYYKLTRVEDMNKSQYDEFCKKLETPKESKGA